MPKRDRRTYGPEFKSQIVQLYQNGKRKCDIVKEYELAHSLLDRWIRQGTTTGSFKAKDNRSELENQLIELQKENKRLLMENDVLKQAALIMGRR